jgi:hypothetical protein
MNDTSYDTLLVLIKMKQKKKNEKNENGRLKKTSFSIFFHENFMDWSLG